MSVISETTCPKCHAKPNEFCKPDVLLGIFGRRQVTTHAERLALYDKNYWDD